MRYLLAILLLALMVSNAHAARRTFGNTAVGASSVTHNTATPRRAVVEAGLIHTAGPADTVDSIFINYSSNGGDDNVLVRLYTVSGGNAGSCIDDTVRMPSGDAFPTYGWEAVDVNIPLTNGTVYCLAVAQLAGSGTVLSYMHYDIGSSGDCDEGLGSNLPCPNWGITHTDRTYKFSLYAVLNPSEDATGPPDYRHGGDGGDVRSSPNGGSKRH